MCIGSQSIYFIADNFVYPEPVDYAANYATCGVNATFFFLPGGLSLPAQGVNAAHAHSEVIAGNVDRASGCPFGQFLHSIRRNDPINCASVQWSGLDPSRYDGRRALFDCASVATPLSRPPAAKYPSKRKGSNRWPSAINKTTRTFYISLE